jgi:ABC-type bacteriocin/lantibiotic exporter with double-glycine peptidase domain
MKIRDIFQEDIDRPIEEVIKVDQVNEAVVYEELREYVPTDALQRHFREVLEAINASRTEPTEGIGVWISGFFGSGKSSFAKMLGYILAQQTVKGLR